ncbi:translation initiation factor IF-2 N-terminal domain-containing protein [Opitutales bacterium]|nr:translation initiation factor IF-2 N-terminal domain-containing protein [Opitutales bacterium]
MSVRVHAIAKQVNKSSKELIEILTERGYEIKSASASIDNITAQSIIDEFSALVENENVEVDVDTKPEQVVKSQTSKKAPIVKSKTEIEEEKKLKEEAKKAEVEKNKPKVVAPEVPPPPFQSTCRPCSSFDPCFCTATSHDGW